MVFILFTLSNAFCAENLSSKGQQKIDSFMNFRMELSKYSTPEECLKEISKYSASNFSKEALAGLTDEEKLILKNFEVLETYNYMRQIKSRESEIKQLIKSQYNVNKEWFLAHKDGLINKWLYCTAGDMLSCNLRYASVADIMHDGLAVKSYYEKAIELDGSMSYALTNIAQWCYYAPVIGGGGKSKAGKSFEKATKCTRNNAEEYFAKIFLSQYYMEDKSTVAKAGVLLNEADSLMPGGYYIKWLREINKQGYSLYYYNTHKVRPEDAQ